jgi:hypothetical protein
MPDLSRNIIDKVKAAGFRYVQFAADKSLVVSKDSKSWESFDCKAERGGITLPALMPMDLETLY